MHVSCSTECKTCDMTSTVSALRAHFVRKLLIQNGSPYTLHFRESLVILHFLFREISGEILQRAVPCAERCGEIV